jgi:hypothetical protein
MLRATTSFAVCAALAAAGLPFASAPGARPEAAPISLSAEAGAPAMASPEHALAGKPSSPRKKPKPPKGGRDKPPAG